MKAIVAISLIYICYLIALVITLTPFQVQIGETLYNTIQGMIEYTQLTLY